MNMIKILKLSNIIQIIFFVNIIKIFREILYNFIL